jgi:hypothetical protein
LALVVDDEVDVDLRRLLVLPLYLPGLEIPVVSLAELLNALSISLLLFRKGAKLELALQKEGASVFYSYGFKSFEMFDHLE